MIPSRRTNPSEFKKGGEYPVEFVSWNDAQDFIGKLPGFDSSKSGESYGSFTLRLEPPIGSSTLW